MATNKTIIYYEVNVIKNKPRGKKCCGMSPTRKKRRKRKVVKRKRRY